MPPKRLLKSCLILTGFMMLSATSVFAVGSGGFENASYSPISLGQGNAVVAQGDEPAAISYNPAAIVDLPGIQSQYNSAIISFQTWYDGDGPGQPDLDSSDTLVHIPLNYFTVNPGKRFGLNGRLAFGLGTDAPFGLVNKYDSRHPAVRYTTGASNWIKMFAVRPVAAFKINDKLSIGGGPIWYRVFGLGTVTQYPNFSIVAGSVDGQMRANLKGNRWGWQAGAKYKATDKHHLGFYFRSPVNINTRGQLEVENPVLATTIRVGARAKLSLPLHITAAYAFHPTERTTVEFDLGWTKWSDFKRIVVHADPVTTSAIGAINAGHDALIASLGVGNADYRDTFSIHVGGNHKINDKFTVRGGSHFYWTPLPKHHFRPNLPDANSLGFSVGGSYEVFKNFSADVVYYNRFLFTRTIDNDISETLGTTVDGKYFSYIQELMVGIRYFWDVFGDEVETEPVVAQAPGNPDTQMKKSFWQSLT